MIASLSGQQYAVRVIQDSLRKGRCAGTYLFHGPAGVGQEEVALWFARAVLCRDGGEAPSPDTDGPCEQCRGCRLSAQRRHPDLMVLRPDRDGAGNPIITMETLRQMQDLAGVQPSMARHRTFILHEAHAMRVEAANSLLKLLEEPPPFGLFLLTTSNLEAILPTIRSRAQSIRLTPAARAEVAAALEAEGVAASQAALAASLADGRLELARTLLDGSALEHRQGALELLRMALEQGEATALKQTETYKGREQARELVHCWQSLLRDAVLARGGLSPALMRNADLYEELRSTLGKIPDWQLHDAWERTFQLEENLAGNANVQLALDDWLVGLIESRKA